jgi:hypothetical protein
MEGTDLHALAEERSLAFHRFIAELLRREPALLDRARTTLAKWRTEGTVAVAYIDRWEDLFSLGLDQICRALTDEGEQARALRQTTPFAGAIDPRKRWQIHREVRKSRSR